MIENHFPVKLKLRIDWSELDYFGHVNNVSFFKYIQSSRVNYWDKIGLTQFHLKKNIGPLLASATCNFKKPLMYPGEIIVQARVAFIKNSSFSFHHQILELKENGEMELAAEAEDVMVMFDFNTNEKISFPDTLRSEIQKIEGKTI